MVRVASCHHFVSQDVFLSENEPVAFCGAEDKLLVATTQHDINVHDLNARGTILQSFSTVGTVKQIIYCESANYVATVESNLSEQSSFFCHVRVYFNWWIEVTNQTLKIRIAGSLPSLDECSSFSKLEMVELPLEKPALFISCCNRTSSLCVSVGNIISVFCYSRKKHPTTKLVFQDFEHFVDIKVPFIVQELSMCENYFACRSEQACHVFKIMSESEDDSTPSNSGIEIHESELCAENFVEWRFESCTASGARDTKWEHHLKSRLNPKSFPIDIHFHAIDKENESFTQNVECEYHGPLLTIRGCTVEVRLDPKAFEMFPSVPSKIYAVTLLFRQFVFKENEPMLSTLQVIPLYYSESPVQDPLNAAALESEKCIYSLPFPNLIPSSMPPLQALGCFFSSPQEGFLYEVVNEVELVSSFRYTSSMKGVWLENSLLHALTETGLETYTTHLPHSVFQKSDKIKQNVPKLDDSNCLLGLRPFLGVDHLVASENNLILVSSIEDSVSHTEPDGGNRSTLYSLREPSCIQIYEDLLESAESHKANSPNTYYHLLSEAHYILRADICFGKSYNGKHAVLFSKSCLLLADHFLCYDPANNMNSVYFYHQSQLATESVIKRILDYRHQAKYGQILKPLVEYLNFVIFDEHKIIDVSQAVSDAILSAYAEEAPDMLWKVILCSNLSGYKQDKAILMLKRKLTNKCHPLSPTSNAADTTALVFLLLQKGNTEIAQTMLSSLIKDDFVVILGKLNHRLWTKNSLTDFGKFVKKHRPDAFLELLIAYIKSEKYSFPQLMQFLQNEVPDSSPHNAPLLKEFLELILNDKSLSHAVDSSSSALLVKIYLKRLLEPQSKSTFYQHPFLDTITLANLLNSRPLWLNEMPPFYGKSISRTCSQEKQDDVSLKQMNEHMCICWACNQDLLKLQSVLSHLGPTEELKNLVLNFLCSPTNQAEKWLSLEIMCSDEAQAIKKLLICSPKALLSYSKETFQDDQRKWTLLFNFVYDHIRIIPDNHPEIEMYSKTFHEILGHLSENFAPVDFLSLLPKEANSTFVPHVKRCIEKHQADQLKKKIMSLGQEIKSMMVA